jgi:L,D-peptidoglycan transpeptidase YkuD (ErfK/YbiS/YcfS/YnhG family)
MKLKKLTAIITMLGLSALALSACSGTAQTAAPAEAAAVESTVESTATTEMEPAEEAAQPTDESAVTEALKEEVAAEQTAESMYVLHQERVASPEWVTKLPAAQDENVKQLFVVAGLGMDKTTASISMHERSEDGKWEQILSTPGFVGKNGLCLDADHKEGCGQTPVGVYKFNKAFGIAADPGCAIPYIQVTDDTYWSGDIREGYHYNEMVNLSDYPDLDMENSEHIVDYIYQYQYCLNISFNEDGTAGRGSAIFLHSFGPTKPYTGGCVALPEYMMKMVMTNVDPDCVVVIDTLENMDGEL